MTDTAVITDVPDAGPPPIWDTTHLLRRIQPLPPDRAAELRETWEWNHWGPLVGCIDADTFRTYENAIANAEPSVSDPHLLHAICERFYALPDAVRSAAAEQLSVYAGVSDPSRWLVTSTGRLAECDRIVTAAEAHAVTLADTPSVTELPPADDHADQIASTEYPGVKADAKTVMAWVGEDRNRAARAYVHEQDRPSPRKGVTSKLEAILGDGLKAVTDAIANATPPPLDLSAVPPVASPATSAETGAAAPEAATSEPSVSVVQHDVEAEAAAPTAYNEVRLSAEFIMPSPEVEDEVAAALRKIGQGFIELAEAIA